MVDADNKGDSGSENSSDSGSNSDFEGFDEEDIAIIGNIQRLIHINPEPGIQSDDP